MIENRLEDLAKTLQEAILQEQNEQFKIIIDSLKAALLVRQLQYQNKYQNKQLRE